MRMKSSRLRTIPWRSLLSVKPEKGGKRRCGSNFEKSAIGTPGADLTYFRIVLIFVFYPVYPVDPVKALRSVL